MRRPGNGGFHAKHIVEAIIVEIRPSLAQLSGLPRIEDHRVRPISGALNLVGRGLAWYDEVRKIKQWGKGGRG